MKKMFKEHDLVKIIGIMLLLVVVLSWIIPTGTFSSGATFTEGEMGRLGLAHLFYGFSYAIQNYAIQIGFLLMVGVFYGVVSKTEGYKEFVNRLAKAFKGKEILVSLIISFVIVLLTSVLNNTFVLIVFMPILITILRKLGLDKISSFAITFGSMLVGVLGATIGTEGLDAFVNYIGYGGSEVTLTTELGVRVGIAFLAYALYSFFNYLYIKKLVSAKKSNEEEKDDAFYVEDSKKKGKAKIWPVAVMFGILFVLAVLGFVYWNKSTGSSTKIFGLEIFDNFFEWMKDIKIGDVAIISSLFGGEALPNMSAKLFPEFGSWYLFTYSIFLAITILVVKFVSKMKFNDMLTNAYEGIKVMIKPTLFLILAYMMFVLLYWSPILTTILNEIGKLSGSFNPFVVSLQAFIASIFNTDFAYIGYSLSYAIGSFTGTEGNITFLIYTTIYGLVQFVTPISVFLLFGLSYMNIPYKKWLKYIWKFFVGMLVCLLIIFTILWLV